MLGYPLHSSWQQKLNVATFLLIVWKGQKQQPQQGGIIKKRLPPPPHLFSAFQSVALFSQLIRVFKTIESSQGSFTLLPVRPLESGAHLWGRPHVGPGGIGCVDLRSQPGDFMAQPELCPRSPPSACTPRSRGGLGNPSTHTSQQLAGPDKGVAKEGLTRPPHHPLLLVAGSEREIAPSLIYLVRNEVEGICCPFLDRGFGAPHSLFRPPPTPRQYLCLKIN